MTYVTNYWLLPGGAGMGFRKANGAEVEYTAAQVEAVLAVLAAVTPGISAASKAVVLDASAKINALDITALTLNGTALTATAAELNKAAGVTAGTVVASKAVVVGASKQVNEWFITGTSASTSPSASVEPMVMSSTLTGPGGVGGRALFRLDTNVALGGWSNALKGMVVYGAAGRTNGLGSALVAEMTMSAGTTQGNYAPLEIELNMGAAGKTGTATAMIYASVNDAAATEFDTNGFLLNLAGLSPGTDKLFEAESKTGIAKTHTLRVRIGGTAYFIPLHTAKACGGT